MSSIEELDACLNRENPEMDRRIMEMWNLLARFVNREESHFLIKTSNDYDGDGLISAVLPMHILDTRPKARILVISRDMKIAKWTANLARETMSKFSIELTEQNCPTRFNIETAEGGFCRFDAIGCAIAGISADYIIVDNPSSEDRVRDWFNSSLYTRRDYDGSILVVSPDFHKDDHIEWEELEIEDIFFL